MSGTYKEITDYRLKVGMNVGVQLYSYEYGNGAVIEKGEIISIEEGVVRVMNDKKLVSAYQLGYFKFLELV